jgi:hypothetical protein
MVIILIHQKESCGCFERAVTSRSMHGADVPTCFLCFCWVVSRREPIGFGSVVVTGTGFLPLIRVAGFKFCCL